MKVQEKMIGYGVEAPARGGSRPQGFVALSKRTRIAGRVRRSRVFGVLLAIGLLLGLFTSLGVPVASAAKLPPANDIGITPTTIHIAIIADVNNTVNPGVFKPSVNVMRAWTADVNAHGGLAGRKVVLDFCDSMLNPNASNNCVIQACSKDFALVGTAAVVITDFQNIDDCTDEAGKAIGIPDLAGITFGNQEDCDPDTFAAIGGNASYCATQHDTPQTYTEQVGDYRYFLSKFKHLTGIWVYNSAVPGAATGQLPSYQAGSNVGVKKAGLGFYPEPGDVPQSGLTPIVDAIKQFSVSYVGNGSTPQELTLLRKEAQLQGVTSVKAWECQSGCYDTYFTEQGGASVDGTYQMLETIPFYTECKLNPALARFSKYMGGTCAKLDSNSMLSLMAAFLFQNAVNKIVDSGKTLDRASLFNELKTGEHSFTADGLEGPTNVSGHEESPCFMMVQVIHGKWQRVYPTKPGTLDCSTKNRVTFQYNGSA